MKTFTKLSATVLVLASLGLTACAQELPNDRNRVPGASSGESSSSASPSPTFTALPSGPASIAPVAPGKDPSKQPLPLPGEAGGMPVKDADAAAKSIDQYPLQIDIDYALKNYADPKLNEVFPKENFDVKEGVRYGLSLYQDLTSLQDFYEPRDGTKDFELILPFADKMTAEALEAAKADIAKNGHYSGIPTADSTGTLGTTSEGINLKVAGVPQSFWNSPGIRTIYDKKYGNVIEITGYRTIGVVVDSGETVEIQQKYVINVAPSGDKNWLVSSLYWNVESTEVLK